MFMAPTPEPASVRFKNCPLVEIVHLHDCLRNTMRNIRSDITRIQLGMIESDASLQAKNHIMAMEQCSIASLAKFQLCMSVFEIHSKAEDKHIFPRLQKKLGEQGALRAMMANMKVEADERVASSYCGGLHEDHANEEKMLKKTFAMLKQMRKIVKDGKHGYEALKIMWTELAEQTAASEMGVSEHLLQEETICMPVIMEVLSISEMTSLVGDIMGERNKEQVQNILTLAVNALPPDEKDEMLLQLNKAMRGTFFERWALPQFGAGGALVHKTYEGEASERYGEASVKSSPPERRKSSLLMTTTGTSQGK
mmetsp:Transcript_21939/g.45703  ORF Transcript_21939/g.45703 Transcript_21939/m.45703 type:complete len:310 (+) Transcript_21939:159-1088(+)